MKGWIITGTENADCQEIQKPIPKDDEVQIKVMAAGICGTDIHIYKGEYFGTYPRIVGHEFSGIITAKGKDVSRFEIGQRVSADPNIFCESCDRCKENKQNFCQDFKATGVTRDGAFAQYLTIPERCVFDIGDIPFEDASMIEPLSCVVYGQDKLKISLASNVLIFGAGSIGLLHLQVSRMNGAASISIVDPVRSKLEIAKRLGADNIYTPDELRSSGLEKSFDYVIDCTGIPGVIEKTIEYVKDAGTLLFFGVAPEKSRISIDPYEIFRRELTITSSFALKKTFGRALELIKNKRIDVKSLITDILDLDELSDYFADIDKKRTGIKTIVKPN